MKIDFYTSDREFKEALICTISSSVIHKKEIL